MMLDKHNIKYIKHNRARLKANKREESTKRLLQFFGGLEGKVKGMSGFVIMDSLKDFQESIVITFWETKDDMDSFYRSDNKVLADFVESSRALFEEMPERNDYAVSSFKI
jgi:heme-degrading monooxygenase HmoA